MKSLSRPRLSSGQRDIRMTVLWNTVWREGEIIESPMIENIALPLTIDVSRSCLHTLYCPFCYPFPEELPVRDHWLYLSPKALLVVCLFGL